MKKKLTGMLLLAAIVATLGISCAPRHLHPPPPPPKPPAAPAR